VTALGAALDQHFGFSSIIRGIRRPVMLVGPAGAGKTLTAAKILTRTVLEDVAIEAATTDHKRAGGVEQLKAFTDILSLPLGVAHEREDIRRISARARQAGMPLVIDSAGINPYDDADLSELAGFIVAAEAEPVLVLPVGTDPAEAGDWAEIFAKLGCRRLVVTRLDSARRFGAMLAAASAGELRLAHATMAPSAAEGLADVTPMGLARLILNDPDLLETRSGMEEQAQ
jgi:flagellar biosynthesis protein FlhF